MYSAGDILAQAGENYHLNKKLREDYKQEVLLAATTTTTNKTTTSSTTSSSS